MRFQFALSSVVLLALVGCAETSAFDEAASPAAAVDTTTGVAAPRVATADTAPGLAAAIVEAPVVIAPEPVPTGSLSRQPRPAAGIVTAGDIDDALNLAAFNRFASSARRDTGLPLAALNRPLLAQLLGPQGTPAPGVRVTLRAPGADTPFYDGYSGVDGRVTVFPGVHGAGNLSRVELRAFPDNVTAPVSQTLSTGTNRASVTLPEDASWDPEFLDLMFVVDTTGSMADELAFLTREMTDIVRSASASARGVDIRYGLVVYRDDGDAYTVRAFDFTGSARTMRRQLGDQSAQGGGDYPEAAAAALSRAVDAGWRRGQGERILIHVADAPPHDEDAGAYLAAARTAARANIQIFGLGASGVADKSEYLMRQAALQTNGRYMFLTDDSGVGNSHAEPTVSCYRVTTLKSLLIRVLQSELSGIRVEAPAGDVRRTVGTYRNGVCLN